MAPNINEKKKILPMMAGTNRFIVTKCPAPPVCPGYLTIQFKISTDAVLTEVL
jgi:hypothetical protein